MTYLKIFRKIKTDSPSVPSNKQKGVSKVDGEEQFRELFQKVVELYQLSPEVAAELLQRILAILVEGEDEKPPD